MTIPEAMTLAVAYHQQGALQQAEQIYRQVLAADPNQADAIQLLGVIAAQVNRRDLAIDYFNQALRLRPAFPEAHFNLGVALLQQGSAEGAIASFRQAIDYKPDYAEAHHNLGVALRGQEKNAEALASLQTAVRLRPDFAQAHNDLGLALAGLGQQDAALAHFREAVRLSPNFTEAHNNLGVVFQDRGQLDEAAACYWEAIRLSPNFAEGHCNLAHVLLKRGEVDDALVRYEEALRLNPRQAKAENCRGTLLLDRGEVHEALASLDRAVAIEPDFPEAHLNRGVALLLLGRLQEGWPEYDWRIRCKEYPETLLPLPHWDGSDLTGKTIVLYGEQGLGDTLQFIRYAPLVKARGGTVVAACPPILLPVLARCPGIDRLVAKGPEAAEAGTVQALLLSLPGIFKTTLDTIPTDIPYLFADPARLESWRDKLAPIKAFKVGILWQGSPLHPRDRWRSVPLIEFAPLAQIPGVRLFNLQVDVGREQLAALDGRFDVTDLSEELAADPFAETAPAMKNLDLVVTIDTAVAHLAGGLGVPVWVALPFGNDWRWLQHREDSPWYPTMRHFRQRQRGHWQEVFQRMAEALPRH
jgi:tetratricopeptide (TPR) repeat protein